MDRVSANPLYVMMFFALRCILPLMIMLGISYVLRKLGLVKEPPTPPADKKPKDHNGDQQND